MANSTFEKEGNLRNNRDVLPQRVKSHLEGIVISNFKGSRVCFKYSEECLNERRLASSGSSHNSYLLALVGFEGDIFEDSR